MSLIKFLLLVTVLFSLQKLHAQTKISLNSSGNQAWKLIPQTAIGKDSAELYKDNYSSTAWVTAIVPGAVFSSYVAAGLEQDPNFADNIYKVDKSKYNKNFWYRTSFITPATSEQQKVWLNFEGINRKGEIFFNGIRLGLLDGFMQRGKFDITGLLRKGQANTLAVLVYWPTLPVPNYASPTYISSDGWDWMPSVPGLLQGITDDVFLTITGAVTIDDPWIRTMLPTKELGLISVAVALKNNSDKPQNGAITGIIQPGNIRFSQPVRLNAGQASDFLFDSSRFKQLAIKDPLLWWPNGYGKPDRYTLELSFSADGKASDSRKIQFGIKQYTYDTIGGVLHININGERVFIKGGNWGMSEYLLRCRGEEYDLKLRLHQEMNFNMVRNWIGSVTDEEFYDACDKYGIMVWDDFWLNSHPNSPTDVFAFNQNAVEKIKRLRNHPSIAIWCGDNEGYPQPPLNGWLREDVKTYDGGDRLYQANSHSDGLTGSGPWTNFHPNWYFTKYPGGFGGDPGWGFRTEIGTAVFVNFESFKKFMPDSNWWPRNQMWDKHFFGPSALNGGPDRYFSSVNTSYGDATGIEDFCRKSQLLNIETNKALYEGWQHHMWNDASGVMTWMSQSAYPSLVWQTYDYYYDLNGAYWGVKKACEPVHIQWSYADNSVAVANTSGQSLQNLKAEASIYNIDGKKISKYGATATVDSRANTITPCFKINFSSDNMVFSQHAVSSSNSNESGEASAVTDGSNGSRWSSHYTDNEWIYVDLGERKEIASVMINWESAYAKAFKLQLSDDAINWKDVYETTDGKGGLQPVSFKPQQARFVKMLGIRRATEWGYSIYELEVYGRSKTVQDLSPVHFIRLQLTDEQGKKVSDNFYWRSSKSADYKDLSRMPKAKLAITSRIEGDGGRRKIIVNVLNTGKTPAFAIHVQARRKKDGERILPVIMNDNYFTLFSGESKQVEIEFAANLLAGDQYRLTAEPFNNK